MSKAEKDMYPVALKMVGDKLRLTYTGVCRGLGSERVDAAETRPDPAAQSYANTRRAITDLIACNTWDYYVTISIRRRAIRGGIDDTMHAILGWLHNQKKRNPSFKALQYVLVPELGTDGRSNCHIHGVVRGINTDALQTLRKSKKLPTIIAKKLRAGAQVYHCPAITQHIGYNCIELIENSEKVARYCVKSIQVTDAWRGQYKPRYYTSKGLARPVTIAHGRDISNIHAVQLLATAAYKIHLPDSDASLGNVYLLDNTPENIAYVTTLMVSAK